MTRSVHGCVEFDWADDAAADAADNPPVQYQEATDLIDGLGVSLAIGALADAAGFPAGRLLVQDVDAFIATHMPAATEPESGNWLTSLVSAGGAVTRAVGKRALQVLEALERSPTAIKTLVAGGVVYGIGAQWLSASGEADLARIGAQTQLLAEAASNMSPDERRDFAARLIGELGGGGSGAGVWQWLGIGAGVLALVWIYRMVRP